MSWSDWGQIASQLYSTYQAGQAANAMQEGINNATNASTQASDKQIEALLSMFNINRADQEYLQNMGLAGSLGLAGAEGTALNRYPTIAPYISSLTKTNEVPLPTVNTSIPLLQAQKTPPTNQPTGRLPTTNQQTYPIGNLPINDQLVSTQTTPVSQRPTGRIDLSKLPMKGEQGNEGTSDSGWGGSGEGGGSGGGGGGGGGSGESGWTGAIGGPDGGIGSYGTGGNIDTLGPNTTEGSTDLAIDYSGINNSTATPQQAIDSYNDMYMGLLGDNASSWAQNLSMLGPMGTALGAILGAATTPGGYHASAEGGPGTGYGVSGNEGFEGSSEGGGILNTPISQEMANAINSNPTLTSMGIMDTPDTSSWYSAGGGIDPTGGAGYYRDLLGSLKTDVSPEFSYSGEMPSEFSYAGEMPSEFSYSLDENDPAYQFKLQQAQKAIDQAAAARGMYNSRPTINALSDAQMAIAADEADRQFQRQKDVYGINYQREADMYNRAKDVYGINYQREGDLYNRAKDVYGINYQRNADVYNRDYGKLSDLFNMTTSLGGLDYSKQLDLTKLGAGAASSAGQGALATGQGLSSVYGQLGSSLGNYALLSGQNQADYQSGLGAVPNNYLLMSSLLS